MNASIPISRTHRLVAAAIAAVGIVVAACSSGASSLSPSPPAGPSTPPLFGDPLDPGTYSITRGTLKATISVPAGWSSLDERGVLKGDDQTFVAVMFWPFPEDFTQVYSDPCHWMTSAIDPPVGPTVDDLANALAAQEMRGDPVPMAVTVGGHEGKSLVMSVPTDIDIADCDDGYFYSWLGRYHQGPGQIDVVYILDVDGERQVLIAHHMPGVSAAALAEQQGIVESIVILP